MAFPSKRRVANRKEKNSLMILLSDIGVRIDQKLMVPIPTIKTEKNYISENLLKVSDSIYIFNFRHKTG